MSLLRLFILVTVLFFTNSSWAVYFSIEGFPSDYNVYEWNPLAGSPKVTETYQSGRYKRMTFSIPDDLIVRTEGGQINLLESLESWRRGTPKGPGFPYTENSIGRFPFMVFDSRYDSDNSLSPTARPITYISIAHLLNRVEQFPDLRFSAHNGEEAVVARSSLVKEMEDAKAKMKKNIEENGSYEPVVDCDKGTTLGDEGPWTPMECYLCNCANEAGVKNDAGKIAVNRATLRRVVSKAFPSSKAFGRSICGAVMFQNLSGGVRGAAYSWTLGRYQTHHRLPDPDPNKAKATAKVLEDCVNTGKEALRLGPGPFDHYYNPEEVNSTPAWAKGKRFTQIGAHRFFNLYGQDDTYADALELENGEKGHIARPIAGFNQTVAPPQEDSDANR